MAEFKLDRFKYNWKGEWTTGTAYKRDDIVRVNGRSYVCIVTHTASSTFEEDLTATLPDSVPPQPQPRWTVMTSGRYFAGDYQSGTDYNIGDIVVYDGVLWLCNTAHTATGAPSEVSYWDTLTSNISYIGDWASSTVYGPGALVKYGGIVYKCLNAHQSSSTLENNASDWEEFHNNIEYKSDWTTSTTYRKNDLVKYGPTIFRCTETHTSTGFSLDISKFELEFPGSQTNGEWNSNAYYQQGDIVRYGGYLYFAIENNFEVEPSRPPEDSTVSWIVIAKTFNFIDEWSLSGVYKTGDVVLRGGRLYKAVRDVNTVFGDGSSVDYLDPDVWELLTTGQKWTGSWNVENYYSVGDVVYHLGTAYVCNFEHESTSDNRPGDNGNIYAYWDILVQAGADGGLHDKGDLLTYGLSREFTGDGSTLGDVRLPIGEESQFLSVSSEQETFWRNFTYDADVVYVSTNGQDATGYGVSWDKPFKTIRHACEYVEDTFAAGTPVKIWVSAGKYEEIGPIAVPAGTVVNGDELRSSIVAANQPITEYNNDFQYVQAYNLHISTFILDLITNNPVIPTSGNIEEQVLQGSVSDATTAQAIIDLLVPYEQFIEFRVESGNTDPTMSGSNTETEDAFRLAAYRQLSANKEFIASEIYAWLVATYPNTTFTRSRVISDVRALVRGLARDIRYSGNYGTLYAARRYCNAANGSQLDDLFYMRDTTGLVSLTTEGLEGTLNPPGVFDLYQKPTGGALVSLDPGWGPDDERVWITNRSPFMQSVTNFGNNCVGAKVDGALHNGGNKSIVCNDFTQILSDGIGVWVTNNARAELISIFTYYCAVGYLAEDGGVIRSANGNNSYGKYGSIASGFDADETPQTVSVNNRNNEAQVYQGFAGGADDRILIYEYSNAGEQYTTATSEIIGAGDFAGVEFTDFRDGALFNARLINTQGSGREGGSNYLLRRGYAQVTASATSSIILSANDVTQFLSEIEGMRITIISGDGVGQYGIIDSFNPVTKEVGVIKESTGAAGWDHVIAGHPIETSLDSTAYYNIEPRIVCNHPGFSSTSKNLPISKSWADINFGGTSAQYNSLIGQVGTGDTFDGSPVLSTWRVNRAGSTYTPTIINPGAGYAIGDTITIVGTNLGGTSPTNDLIITVTETSDDSTNAITAFTYAGTPRGGRFIAIDTADTVIYSDNGESWSSTSVTASSGDYIKLLAANNTFLAIQNTGNSYLYSQTGETWTGRTFPATADWSDSAYGNGRFVVIAGGSDTVVYGTDGLSWTASTMPLSASWEKVAYGQGTFVAVASGASQETAYSTNGSSWTSGGNLPSAQTWVSLSYGNNRFLAVAANGTTAYSIDKGVTWYAGGDASLSSALTITDVKYKQGVFFAVGTSAGNNIAATSEDGIIWTQRTMPAASWSTLAFATLDDIPTWVTIANTATSGGAAHIVTGAQAKVRPIVTQGSISDILIWDPGSGYSALNPITFTVTDTQFVTEVEIDDRIGNGVIAQPDFVNRGQGYRTSTSTITIEGDGYADIIPESTVLTLSGVSTVPGPGVQIRINGILDEDTDDPDDLLLFAGVTITDLGDDGTGNDTKLVRLTVSPRLRNEYNLAHGTTVTLRERYSQCRITGHDFLDIGTGNFEETNYPEIYAGGNYFVARPENEVYESGGGRVFYVSTDQDGNFRAGELFSVQQSTGIVTISAEYFDLDGLSELALGGVRLGGSGTVINEFSTDGTMSADSNNVVPTQRAITTFLADRLSVGGEELEVNGLIAGVVQVGTSENLIKSVADEYYYIPVQAILEGTYDEVDEFGVSTTKQVGMSGSYVAMMMFLKENNDIMQ